MFRQTDCSSIDQGRVSVNNSRCLELGDSGVTSPQRPPGTLGMVVERTRPPGELEHLVFYCDKCGELVHDLEFDLKDIVVHFKQMMEDFWANDQQRTCKNCGTRVERPSY